MENTEDY